jgi:hypothetical protein
MARGFCVLRGHRRHRLRDPALSDSSDGHGRIRRDGQTLWLFLAHQAEFRGILWLRLAKCRIVLPPRILADIDRSAEHGFEHML